jgi:hypothetical protein
MQTFLPYPNFQKTAQVLDYRRLGKQRIECKQILNALMGNSKGWVNHPATKMWKGYELSLIDYAIEVCSEWICRGYKDNQTMWFREQRYQIKQNDNLSHYFVAAIPHWLGDERVHSSHRAALLHKAPDHYSQFGWAEEPKLNYFWPNHAS